MPVATETASVKIRTPPSIETGVASEEAQGKTRISRSRLQIASATPRRPPAPASRTLSVSSCRTMPPAGGAQRHTHRDLAASRERAREQQVGDVGAGDQEHERRRLRTASGGSAGRVRQLAVERIRSTS